MAKLALIRHGQSEWNAKGLWTGWTDIALSEKGVAEAREAAKVLVDVKFEVAFCSCLWRAQQTLHEVLTELGTINIPGYLSPALNERNYGDMTGKNKWEIKEKYGDEQFLAWRRGWDVPIPNGETLKGVYERVLPYYLEHILPELKAGHNVVLSAHGNTLRALIKYLDKVPDDGIDKVEVGTGEVWLYDIGQDGEVVSKKVLVAGGQA